MKSIKESLRINGSKYVSSKRIDDNSYKISFTYKNRNYSLDINKKYKFLMLTTTPSIYGMDLNDDTIDLIEYIKQMISYTEYEDYNVFSFSVRKEVIGNEIHNTLQVIKEMDEFDAIIDVEDPVKSIESTQYKIIEYNFGLNTFDDRLFNIEIFEDFNEKISAFSVEDLYLIYITFISYFYKISNNMWEGEKLDPYIIESMINIIYNEIHNRNLEYYEWYNEWNKYFTDENIEKYLNNKDNEKNKKLK